MLLPFDLDARPCLVVSIGPAEQKRKAASLPRGMRLLSQPLPTEPYKPVPVDPRLIAGEHKQI